MEPYDFKKNYFGAEGTLMCEILGNILDFAPAIREGINRAAYNHDVGYSGTKKTNWIARIKNFFERKRLDKQFYNDMEEAIMVAELLSKITQRQADLAIELADIAFKAVRVAGFTFFRTGGTDEKV